MKTSLDERFGREEIYQDFVSKLETGDVRSIEISFPVRGVVHVDHGG